MIEIDVSTSFGATSTALKPSAISSSELQTLKCLSKTQLISLDYQHITSLDLTFPFKIPVCLYILTFILSFRNIISTNYFKFIDIKLVANIKSQFN